MKLEDLMEGFKKNDVIFQEGESGSEMYFIDSGKVKIVKKIKGKEKVLAILKRGDFLGEMSILTGKPRTASAIAMSDTRVLKIEKEYFEDFLKTNVEIAIKLIRKMAERLRETDILLEMAEFRDEKTKITNALYQLAKEKNKGNENVKIDPYELHSRSFTTTEVLKETLKYLTSKGLIKVSGKIIVVPSVERLERFVNFLNLKEEFSLVNEE